MTALPGKDIRLAYHVACTVGAIQGGKIVTSLFRAATLARKGGRDGFAFGVVENGSYPEDGYLIEGAYPYWNIYSNDSPGRWELPLDFDKDPFLRFRLRTDARHRYRVRLTDFSGYDPEATAPWVGDVVITGKMGQEYSRPVRYGVGSYDWRGAGKLITHCALGSRDASVGFVPLSEPVPIEQGGGSAFIEGHISRDTDEMELYIAVGEYYQGDFNPAGLLPTDPWNPAVGAGRVVVNYVDDPVILFSVAIGRDGMNYVALGRGPVRGGETWSGNVLVTDRFRLAPRNVSLKSIAFTATDRYGRTERITRYAPFTYDDSPQTGYDLYEWPTGSEMPVSARTPLWNTIKPHEIVSGSVALYME